ncbi:MAG: hypothetical protein IKP36_07790 [Bacteroidaceae bacterium]|nr:hypothetical protein [Bacteroidaceae bacterium]
MARPKKRYKALLIEPNYSNKFPPIGLMKIATYHKNLGNWDVLFYKGDLKQFIIEQIADKCIAAFNKIDKTQDWYIRKDYIFEYIKTRKGTALDAIGTELSPQSEELRSVAIDFKDFYWKGTWKKYPEWDRVFVTTLFTFYWKTTIETIEFAKLLVKKPKDLMVGGVLASIQPKEIEEATGIRPHVGILKAGDLDKGDTQMIDELPLDYSILDEIEYKYPMTNAYYGYTTRGCIRHCSFCAVPILEPIYNSYIPLKERIERIRELYGEQQNMLLMDNNVLASEELPHIIQDIIDCGFERGAKFTQPDLLAIAIRNLRNNVNDRAYIRKAHSLIMAFYDRLKGEESYQVYKILSKYHILKFLTTRKDALLEAYEEIKDIYAKHFKPTPKIRYVDFNQGVDARLFNEKNVELLSRIAIRPLRIAFDDIRTRPAYEKAIRLSVAAGMNDFSNYLLYNFNDKPVELYQRMKINVDLCEELNISIYSFPMKYHPLRKKEGDAEDFSHNRDYIGKYWNRKYIRAVQAILNSTKGKIGRGHSFFCEAFGKDEDEYMDLLEMPETFIIYRFFFKWLDNKKDVGIGTNHWRNAWKECKASVSEERWNDVCEVIHTNVFNATIVDDFEEPVIKRLLRYYVDFRDDIITEGRDLYELKKEFDQEMQR